MSSRTGPGAGDYAVRPTIPSRFVRDLLARSGLSAAAVLRAFGLPEDADRRPRLRVSVEQFERLYVHACRASGDELLGYLRHKIPRGTYAVSMRLATGGRHLLDFFESAARFYAVFDGGTRFWHVARDGARAILRLTLREPYQRASVFLTHALLLTPWRSAAWLAGEPIPVEAVRLDPRFRGYASQTAFLFGREPELARGAAEVAFSAAWLDAPVRRTPEDVDPFVRTSLRALLTAPPADALEERVRRALVDAMFAEDGGARAPTIDGVARQLHLSRATLARRLLQRRLSFQGIKDDLRRDRAIALLADTSWPIADVAARVGFSEPSAFTRAFRAWTGVSPGQYRSQRRR